MAQVAPFPVSPSFDDGFPDIPGESPRVAILASGSGSNFEAIVDAVDGGNLQIELVGLISNNPGATCLARADRLGVRSRVVDNDEYDEREQFDAAVVETLRGLEAEWVVMAGWMRIATSVLVEPYRDRIINLHPSLLPSCRGAHAVEDALEAGVRITGCTVHLVTEEVDAGPIVAQAAVPVREEDDVDTLQDRIHRAEHWLFPRAIALAVGKADGRKQKAES